MKIKFKQQEFTFLNPLRSIVLFSFEWYRLDWVIPTTVIGFDLKILNMRYRFEIYRPIELPQRNEYFKGSLDLNNDKIKGVLVCLDSLEPEDIEKWKKEERENDQSIRLFPFSEGEKHD